MKNKQALLIVIGAIFSLWLFSNFLWAEEEWELEQRKQQIEREIERRERVILSLQNLAQTYRKMGERKIEGAVLDIGFGEEIFVPISLDNVEDFASSLLLRALLDDVFRDKLNIYVAKMIKEFNASRYIVYLGKQDPSRHIITEDTTIRDFCLTLALIDRVTRDILLDEAKKTEKEIKILYEELERVHKEKEDVERRLENLRSRLTSQQRLSDTSMGKSLPFTIHVWYDDSVKTDKPGKDIHVYFEGGYTYPITVYFQLKPRWKPPYGGVYRNWEMVFSENNTDGNKGIWKGLIRCAGWKRVWYEGRKAKTFTIKRILWAVDAEGKKSNVVEVNYTCEIPMN